MDAFFSGDFAGWLLLSPLRTTTIFNSKPYTCRRRACQACSRPHQHLQTLSKVAI